MMHLSLLTIYLPYNFVFVLFDTVDGEQPIHSIPFLAPRRS
jgi:hypothetical protein